MVITQRELKRLSPRTRTLLAGPEDVDVESKESLSNLGASDLVAVANADAVKDGLDWEGLMRP